MNLRLSILGILLLAFAGYLTFFVNPTQGGIQTEEELLSLLPLSVDKYRFVEKPSSPGQSYKSEDRVYEMLKPRGIGNRIYTHGGRQYEVVVIVSDNKQSFHDPRWCFRASGWTIDEDRMRSAESQARGTMPVAIVTVSRERRKGQLAAFYYQGPNGIYADMPSLSRDLIITPLIKGTVGNQGVFYRFMPLHPGAREEDLLEFIALYADTVHETSGGLL